MDLLKRYKFHILMAAVLFGILLASVRTKVSQVSEDSSQLPKIKTQGQFDHASELIPRGQRMKFLSAQYNGADLRPFILQLVQRSLPKAYKSRAFEITRTLITEANHHDMDPLFLIAVITTESHFNIKARGGAGEIGLMQLLPRTAKWLAPHAGIAEDRIDLEDPHVNIRLGATYFATLRKSFEGKGQYYVSAYNMGSANVRRLLASNVEPKTYSGKVLGNYKRFYTAVQKTEGKIIESVQAAGRAIASVK